MPDVLTAIPPRQRAARHLRSIIVFAATALILLSADLITKRLAFDHVAGEAVKMQRDEAGRLPHIPAHEPVTLIPKVLALQLTINEGTVFGLGQGGRWIFVVFTMIAIVVMAVIFARSHHRAWVLHLSLGAVLAGGLGNLHDRLRWGAVRDLLYLFPEVKLPLGWSWPGGGDTLHPWLFNVADASLVCGLFVLIVLLLRREWKLSREAKRRKAGAKS